MPSRSNRHAGFTLIELLVVVAIIVALLAILMPAMSKAILAAQIAQCASNMRQTSVATIDYAQDNLGVLPRHDFGAAIGRNPNAMARTTAAQLAKRGLGWRMWFCPTREGQFGPEPNWKLATTPITDAEALDQMGAVFGGGWVLWPNFWWIPRNAGNGPCPSFNGQAYELLPTRTSHFAANTFPIVSDFMQTWSSMSNPSDPKLAWGAHSTGSRIVNTNRGFLDGSVTRRTPGEVEYMLEAGLWWNWY